MAGCVLTANFYADIWRVIVQICRQNLADQLVEMGILFGDNFYFFRKRPHQPIGQKYPQKCAHQRAADHRAQNFWWLVDRAHGLDDAKYRRNNSQRRQPV